MNSKKQIIGSAAIVFNENGQVLLGQRNESDPSHKYHLKWNLPGGKVEFGENPETTAIRETQEEVGIKIAVVDHRPIIMSKTEDGYHYLLMFYLSQYISGDLNVEKDHGTIDAKWFDMQTLDYSQCLPRLEDILIEAKKIINN